MKVAKNFRTILEELDRDRLVWLANYELIDFIRIEVLLEQKENYPDFMLNLFDIDWDEGELEAMIIYPKLRSKFESMEENEFADFFAHFVWEESVIDELMFLDKEARENLLENL